VVAAQPVEVRPVLAPQVQEVLAIVVPWVKRSTAPAPTASATATTDFSCRACVGTFAVRRRPSDHSTASVKVPPTSIPSTCTALDSFS
jgi:hypothetical protein